MERYFEKVRDPEFWAQAWADARSSSDFMKKRIRGKEETNDFWNKFASRYEKRSSRKKGKDRVEYVVNLLRQENMLTEETEVLDIGSGPGTYALPFANICRKVTALDGAREMCRELEKKAEEQNLNNIETLNLMWEDVNPEKEGFEAKFDLVFASLAPAIFDWETLNNMNRTSRKNCCLISWAGEAHSQARRDLWEILFNEEYSGNGLNIIYPFNLLFSMGYFPSIQYFNSDHSYTDPVDEAIERLCSTFWLFMEITDEARGKIARYVKERAVDNVFHQETTVRLGIVTWQVHPHPALPRQGGG